MASALETVDSACDTGREAAPSPPPDAPDAGKDTANAPEASPPAPDAATPSSDAAAPNVDAAPGEEPSLVEASSVDGGAFEDAHAEARGGYDGGRVILREDPNSPGAGEPCLSGNVNCGAENMPLILTGVRGIVTEVPMVCVPYGSTTAWAFDPRLCTPGYCYGIDDPAGHLPGCLRACRVPYKVGGYTPGSTGALCN
jgi:hypothetical protein